ncbi:M1 family metallopeptidase [Streptomyces sp. SID13031]|nr:M1 family metallopeptidase [Streptomyces sp. SID13031]
MTKEGFENNGMDGVVLHEVSHEWFGNSVSPKTWSDLWLNEGHAVFYQDAWIAARGLQSQIERAWVRDHANGIGSTEDFIATASKVARTELGPFLRSWLYGTKLPAMPGHPDWKAAA